MTDKNHLDKRIFELHAKICKTLSHPKRLEIIDLLRDEKEMGVSELAEKLGITKANLSQHLSLMRQQISLKLDGMVSRFCIPSPIQRFSWLITL